MPDSQPDVHYFTVSAGLLKPKHVDLTNCPLGLFLYLINRTTREVDTEGWVLGRAPLTYAQISEETGIPIRNLARFKKELELDGYIRVVRTNHYGSMQWFVSKTKKYMFRKQVPKASKASTDLTFDPEN